MAEWVGRMNRRLKGLGLDTKDTPRPFGSICFAPEYHNLVEESRWGTVDIGFESIQ